MNNKVTVVIPVYNVKDKLSRCIESVVSQTYSNLEIILIDDGSTDGSSFICDEWVLKDSRIKVVHKENQGLGMARNTGIEYSTGEYICFFDSDDYVSPETVKSSYELITKENADVVIFGLNTVNASGEVIKTSIPCNSPDVYSGDAVLDEFLPEYIAPSPDGDGKYKFFMSSCTILYSTAVIKDNNWRFVSEREIISEDIYSLIKLFSYVKKVSILPQPYYYYCYNGSSLSRTFKKDRYERIKHFYKECVKMCQTIGYSDKILYRIQEPFLAFTISALKQLVKHNSSFKNARLGIKEIIDDELLQDVLQRNKNDNMVLTRKILFFFMRNKKYDLCYVLLKLKS